MDSSLVAQVLATKTDGKQTIGTAYPISPDLVITAYHVVCFADRDTNIAITIHWPDINGENGDIFQTTVEEEFLCQCSDDDGIAILKCKVPKEYTGSAPILASYEPNRSKKWDSLGYPRLGKAGDIRTLLPAMGEFYSVDFNNPVIQLSSIGDAKAKEDWAGISGAPVFQDCHLYAIIIETQVQVYERFRAISIRWLLTHKEEFCLKLGLVKAYNYDEYFAKIQGDIKTFLEDIDNIPLYTALANKFIPDGLDSSAENIFTGILTALQNDKIQLVEEFRLLCEPVFSKHPESIEPAQKLFELLLGLLAQNHSAGNSKIYHLPVRTKMAVEIELAACYQVPPTLEKVETENPKDNIIGKYAMKIDGLRETGWTPKAAATEFKKVVQVAINKTHEKTYGNKPTNALDEFGLVGLNETLLTRRKGISPELIRFEVEYPEKEEDRVHPLHNNAVCEAIQESQNLPDLPIVRYGFATAWQEAKLLAQVNEFYRLIYKEQ